MIQEWSYNPNNVETWMHAEQQQLQVVQFWKRVKTNKPVALKMLPIVNQVGDYLWRVEESPDQALALLKEVADVAKGFNASSKLLSAIYSNLADVYQFKGNNKLCMAYRAQSAQQHIKPLCIEIKKVLLVDKPKRIQELVQVSSRAC
ncbi:MAG: hypothetical protein AAF310_04050 [Myxococcota bacterium]